VQTRGTAVPSNGSRLSFGAQRCLTPAEARCSPCDGTTFRLSTLGCVSYGIVLAAVWMCKTVRGVGEVTDSDLSVRVAKALEFAIGLRRSGMPEVAIADETRWQFDDGVLGTDVGAGRSRPVAWLA